MSKVKDGDTSATIYRAVLRPYLAQIPTRWYPRLPNGTPEQQAHLTLRLDSIHWPDLDEDIAVQGLFDGWRADEYGTKEAAQYMNCAVSYVNRLRRDGKLTPWSQCGSGQRADYYTRDKLDRFLATER